MAMDTIMTLTAYGTNAKDAVEEACVSITEIEALLSATDENSEIYELNQNSESYVSGDTAEVISRAIEISESTDGAYNPMIYPVVKLWGFPDKNYQVPSDYDLAETLSYVDIDVIEYDAISAHISFTNNNSAIDLGGIAKGYTSDMIMEVYKRHGVESGLVVLGGNVQVLGHKPDGSDYNIAIADPVDAQKYIGAVRVSNKAVITSGGYQRFFEVDGKKYHHILDPDTGYPAENGLISVSIISEDGALADGLSTALYVMGLDKATQYYSLHSSDFDMILMDDKGQVYISKGLEGCFSSDYEYMIINP